MEDLEQKWTEKLSCLDASCWVWQPMSLIGLLTASKMQVNLCRPYETDSVAYEKSMEDPEIYRKGDPNPKVSPSTLKMMASRSQCTSRSATTPTQPHFSDLYRCFTGWGTYLGEVMARGTRFLPKSKLQVNYLELKAVFFALKEYQDLCLSMIVFIAMGNTTMVAHINNEGGMRWDLLWALLWRITT